MAEKLPVIAITMGDVHGIGPEVALKAIHKLFPEQRAVFVLFGVSSAFEYYTRLLQIDLPFVTEKPGKDPQKIYFVPVEEEDPGTLKIGTISRKAGAASVAFIREALLFIGKNRHRALVTAPVSKEAIWRAGHLFPGQTELLANYLQAERYAMMLVSGEFRVGFVTTHHPLQEVPSLITEEKIFEKVLAVRDDLRRRFKVRKPRIAVASLNPHGGESGMLGREEIEVIIPAVAELRERGVLVEGPFPSDTLFIPKKLNKYDAFMALYHDQGMIPIKMHGFSKAVNYTAGLPIVRTSPDHGTAFDIAGKGIADESSMVEAINLAIELVH